MRLHFDTVQYKNTPKPFFSLYSVNKSVCGCRYDDYDYGEVNQLLERDLKLYIKAVACFPDATKTPVCPLSWALLKPSERVRRLFTDYR